MRNYVFIVACAFAQVWPTEAVSTLLGIAVEEVDEYAHADNVVRLNPDTGGGMEIDYKNGYASVQPGDTDEDCLFAAVWKRTDGHRLLGIWLYTPSADNRSKPDGKVLCFYDYDPKTETKDGRLKGGCHMKQKDGKEFNGILTLKKQSQLNDYAE